MVEIGDIVHITHTPVPVVGLSMAPSTYKYTDSLVFAPSDDTDYIICDGDPTYGYHLVDHKDHTIPIGFCLMFVDDLPHIRITQMNYKPEPAEIKIVGKVDTVPRGHNIGSVVLASRKLEDGNYKIIGQV